MGKYWENAEVTNGRLAMIGFLALMIFAGIRFVFLRYRYNKHERGLS